VRVRQLPGSATASAILGGAWSACALQPAPAPAGGSELQYSTPLPACWPGRYLVSVVDNDYVAGDLFAVLAPPAAADAAPASGNGAAANGNHAAHEEPERLAA